MHLFYSDESGEREYSSKSKYFVISSVGIPAEKWKELNSSVLMLKKTYFDSFKVEIKSNWLRRPKERKTRYLSRYPIKEVELEEFVDKFYGVFLSYDIVIIASVIDKERMTEQYTVPQSPSSLAYRYAFERIELFLQNQAQTHGILIFDKITEQEFKKKGYENLLSMQHLGYLVKGTEYVQVRNIVEGLLFIPSHDNNFLQFADLCAYNIHRQFIDYGEEWDKQKAFENRYEFFAKIEPKIYRSPELSYDGYGLKKFPGKEKA